MLAQTVDLQVLFAASWWDRNSGAVGLVSLVVTTIGVAAGVIFYLLQRDTKTFDWQLLTDEPIVTGAAKEAKGGIRVFWNENVELIHPRLITVQLINTGRKEIRPEDLDGEVLVETVGDMKVKSAYPVRRRDGMRNSPKCLAVDDGCVVTSVLYNRGDWVDIQLLVDRATAIASSARSDEDRVGPSATARPLALDLLSEEVSRLSVEVFRRGSVAVTQPVTVDAVVAGQTRQGKRIDVDSRRKQMRSAFLSGAATAAGVAAAAVAAAFAR